MDSPARPTALSPEIDAYLAAANEPSRGRIHALRQLIRQEAPDAIERMAYGMPTWHQGENLVHVAAFAHHVGLYPGVEAIVAFAQDLREFPTSKGAIQLPHDRDLPVELVRRIVRYRVAQAQARHTGKGKATKVPMALRDPGPLTFQAVLQQAPGAGAACFVEFPWDLKTTFGKGNLVPIRALWDGNVQYQGSLAMMGGACAMLLCRTDVVAQLGKRAGETVEVTVTLDLDPREVELPEAFAEALAQHPATQAAWAGLSPSCRREYAQWIADAKKAETRDARIAKALPMIAAKQRLKG